MPSMTQASLHYLPGHAAGIPTGIPLSGLDPALLSEDLLTPSGERIRLRAIDPADRAALREDLFLKLGSESLRNRFFCAKRDLGPGELSRLCRVDFRQHVAIVVEIAHGNGWRMIAVGRFVRTEGNPRSAEFAITVQDHFQGRGIGRLLFERLVRYARLLGVTRLEGTLLNGNRRMHSLLCEAGLPGRSRRSGETICWSLELDSITPQPTDRPQPESSHIEEASIA